jgi:F-type H+-transporting ATPase subunit delta
MASVNSLYARAFADVVISRKLNAAQLIAQLEEISGMIKSSSDLRVVWENPTVPMSQKLKLLDAIAGESGLPKEARNFIGVLIEKHRLKVLPEITAQIKVELNERLGIVEAEISSTRELAPDERTQLEAQLAKTTGKKVQARYERNPSLLGGALVRIGSTIYDGSVRGQLQAIREQIAGE